MNKASKSIALILVPLSIVFLGYHGCDDDGNATTRSSSGSRGGSRSSFWGWSSRPAPTDPREATQHGLFYPALGRKPAIFKVMVEGTRVPRIASARALTEPELVARDQRAAVNKRRYLSLRAVTDEILQKVRYLNQVAVSMRAGLVDLDGAATEIDFTEHQLHELVAQLRDAAGVEGRA